MESACVLCWIVWVGRFRWFRFQVLLVLCACFVVGRISFIPGHHLNWWSLHFSSSYKTYNIFPIANITKLKHRYLAKVNIKIIFKSGLLSTSINYTPIYVWTFFKGPLWYVIKWFHQPFLIYTFLYINNGVCISGNVWLIVSTLQSHFYHEITYPVALSIFNMTAIQCSG